MSARLLLSLIGCTAALCAARGAVTDSLATAEHRALWGQTLTGVNANPAAMTDRYRTALSTLTLEADHADASKPLLYQTGDGHTYGSLRADSYLHLSPRTTVWGHASYRTGRRRNVTWNSTADFALLYPYVMADTVGGDLTTERYTFGGGWATRLGRYDLGAEVTFRAEHEYRTRDPRPRNIVTDLTLTVGAARQLASYRLGLSAGMRFYKQTNDVEFVNELGGVPVFHMTGLGGDYKRFAGSNTSAYYKATGLTAGLDLRPENEAGFYASAAYDFAPYKRILTSLNALPISTLYLSHVRAEAGRKWAAGRIGWAVLAGAEVEWRDGDEHIAGNATANEYPVIADLTMYKARRTRYYAGASFSLAAPRTEWAATLRAGLTDYDARYVFPERHMAWQKVYASLEAQLMSRLPHGRLLTVEAAATGYFNTSAEMQMPLATMSAANVDLVNHTFASARADYAVVRAEVRLDNLLGSSGRYALFGAVRTGATFGADYRDVSPGLAVGLTF